MKKIIQSIAIIVVTITLFSCGQTQTKDDTKSEKKIGVLLVNHGSVAESWRNMLLDVETQVREDILSNPKISKVTTAFMEYTEPSIATRLKEFDEEGFDEVILVPIFLTVSSHYSHDIPVICGLVSDPKIQETLAKEKIDVYKAKAKVTITPPLDYTTLLKKNVERRVKALSENAENEGVLLVAYGDADYNQQWEEMVDDIGKYLKIKTGHESIAYAWCGHLVGYSTEPTLKGIEKLHELEDKVIVIPVLIANDPYFQNDIIQKACDMAEGKVLYIQDAILPDANLNQWTIDITNQTLGK
jgi:cobalamin biosynthesis Co2+ chelatase CbiK